MKAARQWHGTARCVLSAAISCDHAVQLEYLLSEAVRGAPADDVLLVLDSDAWPVASLREHVLPLIDGGDGVELVAVRRAVEGMALWPHPSFAVTTCGLWARSYHSWGLAESLSDVVHHGFTRKLQQQVGSAHVGRTCHGKEYEIDTGSMLWSAYNDSLSKWVALDPAPCKGAQYMHSPKYGSIATQYSSDLVSRGGWRGAVLGPQGDKVYGIPTNASAVRSRLSSCLMARVWL